MLKGNWFQKLLLVEIQDNCLALVTLTWGPSWALPIIDSAEGLQGPLCTYKGALRMYSSKCVLFCLRISSSGRGYSLRSVWSLHLDTRVLCCQEISGFMWPVSCCFTAV